MAALIPNQWKNNVAAYIVAMAYFILRCLFKYNSVPIELIVSAVIGSMWFMLVNYVCYYNLHILYDIILKSEKLIYEMKRILQIFPHGVLITSKPRAQHSHLQFTNEVFDRDIHRIRRLFAGTTANLEQV